MHIKVWFGVVEGGQIGWLMISNLCVICGEKKKGSSENFSPQCQLRTLIRDPFQVSFNLNYILVLTYVIDIEVKNYIGVGPN
jgi:hypothetical protein